CPLAQPAAPLWFFTRSDFKTIVILVPSLALCVPRLNIANHSYFVDEDKLNRPRQWHPVPSGRVSIKDYHGDSHCLEETDGHHCANGHNLAYHDSDQRTSIITIFHNDLGESRCAILGTIELHGRRPCRGRAGGGFHDEEFGTKEKFIKGWISEDKTTVKVDFPSPHPSLSTYAALSGQVRDALGSVSRASYLSGGLTYVRLNSSKSCTMDARASRRDMS
ncbi:hypothetical protein AZE42_05666, partial [Rhizopogon vesiculosus]